MNDAAAMERYCSSYYDRFGLYNDGFPCPDDKYCCENADGYKKCCSINTTTKQTAYTGHTSTILAALGSSSATLSSFVKHGQHKQSNPIGKAMSSHGYLGTK
jgi:hypothetical protein